MNLLTRKVRRNVAATLDTIDGRDAARTLALATGDVVTVPQPSFPRAGSCSGFSLPGVLRGGVVDVRTDRGRHVRTSHS